MAKKVDGETYGVMSVCIAREVRDVPIGFKASYRVAKRRTRRGRGRRRSLGSDHRFRLYSDWSFCPNIKQSTLASNIRASGLGGGDSGGRATVIIREAVTRAKVVSALL